MRDFVGMECQTPANILCFRRALILAAKGCYAPLEKERRTHYLGPFYAKCAGLLACLVDVSGTMFCSGFVLSFDLFCFHPPPHASPTFKCFICTAACCNSLCPFTPKRLQKTLLSSRCHLKHKNDAQNTLL